MKNNCLKIIFTDEYLTDDVYKSDVDESNLISIEDFKKIKKIFAVNLLDL